MPGVTPTKSGHNARQWCGHTCVVYAINPGIHAPPPPIFTTAHACHLLMNAHGHSCHGSAGGVMCSSCAGCVWLRTPHGVALLTVLSRLPRHGRTRKRSLRRSGARRAATTRAKSWATPADRSSRCNSHVRQCLARLRSSSARGVGLRNRRGAWRWEPVPQKLDHARSCHRRGRPLRQTAHGTTTVR